MSRARGAPVGEMGLRSCQDDLDRTACPSVVNLAAGNLDQGFANEVHHGRHAPAGPVAIRGVVTVAITVLITVLITLPITVAARVPN